MPNNSSLPYPIPSLFVSPSPSLRFSPKGVSDTDFSMSPTSPLETTKHFSNTDKNQRSLPIGLALVDLLHNEPKSDKKPFLFVSQLKIQVPSLQPKSPIEFGVKKKDCQFGLHSPLSLVSPPPIPLSPEFLTDMELSEEYTCVISHGPNPKTTHIFDNCIVESCGGNGFVVLRKENAVSYAADDFLMFCDACKKKLSQGRDIFMYRGEKAFCSEECRLREMLLEGECEKFSQDLADLL